jgi:cytochrome c oxidase subunit I+III
MATKTRFATATTPQEKRRPDGDVETLRRIWAAPSGWAIVSGVNNSIIGLFYIGTALLFLLAAGVLALLMRIQLAVPNNDFLTGDTYNQVFTMHGTVMMFLFAVPIIEAVAVYLLPAMLAARDLPFPRLSAYAFWAYFFGGTVFFCSIFFGVAPDGGWFLYPPLTSYTYSPGINQDFWLLGIGFIEISAIAGAIELVVGTLRTRAPGMSLDKMPLYAWAMMVVGLMIVFGFPPVILGTALLELERALHWPFFLAEQGGDPLLWQHLFWLFGHPEVYIIFLPAAGLISMMVPSIAQARFVGYRLVVLALVGTGVLSFGLWVHHMFATGLPRLSLAFFSAASMAVAIPSGIQVFSWLATLGSGRPKFNVPGLFILGFLFIFTLGGLTGVMVAVVPFDWQVHDSYFVVAHFHYVLIGGMVFPLAGALYYWAPMVTGHAFPQRWGKVAFWLMFAGFNLTFFSMHLSGLIGMPRRVYTYPEGLGLELPNLLSTGGAFVFASGILVIAIDFARNLRPADGLVATNPWNASSLEWLPNDNYAVRSIPLIRSRDPLWDQPELVREVPEGKHFLPNAPTGQRETIVTSPAEATPQYLMILPGPGWDHFLAALFTAGFFLLLTVKLYSPAIVSGVLAVAFVLRWVWTLDPGPGRQEVNVGRGLRLPVQASGINSHSGWAVVVLVCVAGSIFASLLFSYFFLWTTNGSPWPPPEVASMPPLTFPMVAVLLLFLSSGLVYTASDALTRRREPGRAILFMLAAVPALVGGLIVETLGQVGAGVVPTEHSYSAIIWTVIGLNGVLAAALVIMAGLCAARWWAEILRPERRATFDCTAMLWHYAVVQALVGIAVVHGAPRIL